MGKKLTTGEKILKYSLLIAAGLAFVFVMLAGMLLMGWVEQNF